MGSAAVIAAALLLLTSPLLRGGNRQAALIVLESIALGFLLCLWLGAIFTTRSNAQPITLSWNTLLIAFVLLSPAWLALVYLTPLPAGSWSAIPGRDAYLQLLRAAGLPSGESLPLSLVPDATRLSLLAGIPLMASFLAGYRCRVPQLRLLLGVVVAMGIAQVMLGLLQIAGGSQSLLYFGGDGGRPIGTFANANHFADYLAMALTAHVWLGWDVLLRPLSSPRHLAARLPSRHGMTVWMTGAVLLVLGILVSQSRGAALTGLPASMLALGLVFLASGGTYGWRSTIGLVACVLGGALALVGLDAVLSRFELSGITSSASIRAQLAATTLAGAWEFWPLGAGWGTYAATYPRFQPMGLDGVADFAHHDYAQMLFEGGIFAALLIAAFSWLVVRRAIQLTRSYWRRRSLDRQEMACALCGLGLLGLLLHSLVEFNMHIPANAIVGALLAGVYLRPSTNDGLY